MLYFKVKEDYNLRTSIMKNVRPLIKNELITEKELNKFGITTPSPSRFERVNISKNKVYTMFGVRMEIK